MAHLYPISLAVLSACVMLAERWWPWRRGQVQLRRNLPWDFLHLVFNGHFLGVILAGLADRHLLPRFDAAVGPEVASALRRGVAAGWPLWLQIPIALLAIDFMQWCVHNLLHRVPALWELHKTHHSVVDGEMDWIVSFRFQWTEVVVYKSLQYVPLVFLGFAGEAMMVHAIFGTLIGHLNHANLDLGHGRWRYVLNSPRMHVWHHAYDVERTVNFGIIFSCWDWIFGTARMPPEPPPRIGFAGVERFPKDFFAQAAWPLRGRLAAPVGIVLVLAGWWLHAP